MMRSFKLLQNFVPKIFFPLFLALDCGLSGIGLNFFIRMKVIRMILFFIRMQFIRITFPAFCCVYIFYKHHPWFCTDKDTSPILWPPWQLCPVFFIRMTVIRMIKFFYKNDSYKNDTIFFIRTQFIRITSLLFLTALLVICKLYTYFFIRTWFIRITFFYFFYLQYF